MRLAITGRNGQVVRSVLARSGAAGVDVRAFGRPEVELCDAAAVQAALAAIAPAAVINAAAYTAVDRAEDEPEAARAVNVEAAGAVAHAARQLGIPVIQLSTDYVFDGTLDRPYRETDTPNPLGVYGRTKLEGERAVAEANPDHAVVRTSWVYSPFGHNFVRTMLTLARSRAELAVVADQRGSPTSALDLADALIAIARRLAQSPAAPELRGTFHVTGGGDTDWAAFARAIFAASAEAGGPAALVRCITTAEYPTRARRPTNSRLDNGRIVAAYGIRLPDWRASLPACVARLLDQDFSEPHSR